MRRPSTHSAPYIWQGVTPALVIVTAYVEVLTVSGLLMASWTDPGVIPRALVEEGEALCMQTEPNGSVLPQRNKTVTVRPG